MAESIATDEWEKNFNEYLKEKYENIKTSGALSKEREALVLKCLMGDSAGLGLSKAQVANLKHKIKKKQYSYMTVPDSDGQESTVLTVPNKKGPGHKPVATIESFFQTLHSIHISTGHGRQPTMLAKVNEQYHGIPRPVIEEFLRGCCHCQARAPQLNQAEPRPIVTPELFSRVQVDLIDMSKKPSGNFHYIVHLMDHFSKFHMIAPIQQKTSSQVNAVLTEMFGVIGPPRSLQSDNGGEFSRIGEIFKDWPSCNNVKIIHGRPRHPQSQGLIERGHRLIQDRLAIEERKWLLNGSGSFLWHVKLPIIQYQVNTSHSSVTKMSAYEVVFGQKAASPPLVGNPTLIEESSVDCSDLLLDQNYSFTPGTKDSQADASSEDENITKPADGVHMSTIEKENDRALPAADSQHPGISTSSEADLDHLPSLAESSVPRHQIVREQAKANYLKSAARRMQPPKKKRVESFSVGSFVTAAVPKADRHKTDSRRLPGVIVELRGSKNPLYRIRCQFGVLDTMLGGGSIQLFQGSLPLSIEGWETDTKISLRTAASMQSASSQQAARCQCRSGCATLRCPCKKVGTSCETTCHAGRSCQNRTTTTDESEEEGCDEAANDPLSELPVTLREIARTLIESSFSNDSCEIALQLIQPINSFDNLHSLGRYCSSRFPDLPTETAETTVVVTPELATYGNGYIPDEFKESHCVYRASGLENRCLYNSCSIATYGTEIRAPYLKLASTLHAAANVDSLISSICQEQYTKDDAVTWALTFLSEEDRVLLESSEDVICTVSQIVCKELQKSVFDNDCGPVQFEALACFLGRQIQINCISEHHPVQLIGQAGPGILQLIRVPANLPSIDGNIRFNHYVPALPMPNDIREYKKYICAAEDLGLCHGDQGDETMYTQCIDCKRALHAFCLLDWCTELYGIPGGISCGCLKIRPFHPKQAVTKEMMVEKNLMLTKLKEKKQIITELLQDICNNKVPSWRLQKYNGGMGARSVLDAWSGLSFTHKSVTDVILTYIRNQMPMPVPENLIHLVLFPELLIRFFMWEEKISRLEAEAIIQDHASGRTGVL